MVALLDRTRYDARFMQNIPLALQLWSLRNETTNDADATLRLVPGFGYSHIETAGSYGWDAEKWTAFLEETGLKIIGAHIGLGEVEANPDVVIAFQKAVGNPAIIVPSLPPELTKSTAGFEVAARRLSEAGAKYRAAGFQFLYHNHAFEFEPLPDGGCGMEILLAQTNPDVVAFEFDTYWLHRGGHEAAEYLHRHANRAGMVHAKEFVAATNNDAAVGQGNIDFPKIVSLAKQNAWPIVVEYEGSEDVAAVATASAIYLNGLIAG